MIARGFKSVMWVGAVGSAALSCYMVSLRVATERADLAKVQHQIVEAKRDIRTLETELGTRGRLTQLEDWNTNVLALSAPSSNQFVKDGFALARLQTSGPTVEQRTGEVRMASLDTGAAEEKPAAEKPQAATAEPSKPKAAPEATPLPRVVQAVAAAPAQPPANPVRRASFSTTEASAAPAQPDTKPTKPAAAPATVHKPVVAAAKPAAPAKAKATPKPVEIAASVKHDAHRTERTAAADKPEAPKPSKPAHAAPKLAHADSAAHTPASGHRGGAQ